VAGKSSSADGVPAESAPDEAPADLIPANGQYPTERVQYEVVVFDNFVEPPAVEQKNVAGLEPVDVVAVLATEGFTRVACGAVLTYTQPWFTKGLALGNLIHSVAVGPGENTRIAMIDWSRRQRGATPAR
jgi:hypothetical protein